MIRLIPPSTDPNNPPAPLCACIQVAVLEVERGEEFGPVKNAFGEGVVDSAETARELLLALHAKWRGGENGEVSPLDSYAGEGLGGKV